MRRPGLWALLALSLVVAPAPAAGAQEIPAQDPDFVPELPQAPADPESDALVEARGRYRAIAESGGWPMLPADLRLGTPPGEAGRRTRAKAPPPPAPEVLGLLCYRLAVTGDIESAACDPPMAPDSYDARLEAAVRRFQARHGLEVDGVVGASTLTELNMPAEARVRQIERNLERRRALPADMGELYVRVNIPAFTLTLVDQGREVLTQRVITGTVRTPTPEFSATIRALEIRPYWKVPDSIYFKELLPQLRRNPGILAKERYEVLDARGQVVDPAPIDWATQARNYRLRQTPGPHNSLGLLKLDLPNPHDVYLHDTPAKARFLQHRRAFSHGCIRVQDPIALAAYLMRGDPRRAFHAAQDAARGPREWTPEAIEAAMQEGRSQSVPLPSPVPVHVVYFTVAVVDGEVRFFPDVYLRDAQAEPVVPAPS